MLRTIVILFLALLFPAHAQAEKRVALVIGNSAYRHAPPLDNPRNDAVDIAAALSKLGLQVIEGVDLDRAGLERKVRDFAKALAGADLGVFFYAGPGLQVSGQNYLVPVDAELKTGSALAFETVRLEDVHSTMEREARTNVLFIDACRNNPLAPNLARSMGTRSTEVGTGLAPVRAGSGTLISFSTQPGNVALDGTGRNSPFAAALVKHVSASSDDLSAILIAVRNDVMKATGNKQVPWDHSALTARVYFSASSVGQAGLFAVEHSRQVHSLGEKHQLPLPQFKMEGAARDAPAALRRFVGIWVDETGGGSGKGRKIMLITTRVDKDGRAGGHFAYGPPGPGSFHQGPAGTFRWMGRIAGESLSFTNANGDETFKLTPADGSRMSYHYSSAKGQSVSLILDPVWTLLDGDNLPKR
jgi:hypothetical protein